MKHLEEAGETYFEHMINAMKISWFLFYLGGCCFIHALVPFLFEKGVSSKLDELIELVNRK